MTRQQLIEEIVKFVMDKANGIDDYNWGQEQFGTDIRQKLLNFSEAQHEAMGVREKTDADSVRKLLTREWGHLENQKMGIAFGFNSALQTLSDRWKEWSETN